MERSTSAVLIWSLANQQLLLHLTIRKHYFSASQDSNLSSNGNKGSNESWSRGNLILRLELKFNLNQLNLWLSVITKRYWICYETYWYKRTDLMSELRCVIFAPLRQNTTQAEEKKGTVISWGPQYLILGVFK